MSILLAELYTILNKMHKVTNWRFAVNNISQNNRLTFQ